ncbi:hypothetical protein ADIS_3130 [Lunatimonas lonarensis]|uniref:Biofilm operon icaADBC HTH-type negative transcriptional regulator IcaR n=1 Tax=Lunatimonas lonarensis TaxID=1232681 RepID=R7ZRC9_9BACT|nr:TetR family transcriptional regulator [Lunatimonas lonarensis]EON76680.1 hypothetical protein ADIS_3130 [Lunatimonas lonarensis]
MKKSIREERKTEIVEGFYKLAQEVGLENASIAKIAKRLDIPPSLIMHYFPSKDLLIQELITFILEHYQLIYEPTLEQLRSSKSLDLEKLVERLFSREWNLLFDDGVFYSCYALIFREPAIKKAYRELHLALRETLEGILKQDPVLAKSDTQRLAEQLFVVVEGAYYYLAMIEDEQEFAAKQAFFKQQVLALLQLEIHNE